MAGFLVPQSLHVLRHPLPQLEQVSEAGKMGFEVELPIFGEQVSSLNNILRLAVTEPDVVYLRLNLVSLSFKRRPRSFSRDNAAQPGFADRCGGRGQKQSSTNTLSSIRSR